MDELVIRMVSRYGHRWTSQYGDDVDGIAMVEWRQTIGAISHTQLVQGFEADRLRGDGWPPASTEFAAWCRGIPSARHVLARMRGSDHQPTPFLMLVWQHVDRWMLAKADTRTAHHLILDAYDQAREHVLAGGALPQLASANIEHEPPPHTPAHPETVREHLRAMAERLGMPDPTLDGDPSNA